MKRPTTDSGATIAGIQALRPPSECGARLLRISQVRHLTGLGRNTIYRWISEGRFPCPVSLGGKRVAWLDNEIRHWIDTRPRVDSIRISSGIVPWSTSDPHQ